MQAFQSALDLKLHQHVKGEAEMVEQFCVFFLNNFEILAINLVLANGFKQVKVALHCCFFSKKYKVA